MARGTGKYAAQRKRKEDKYFRPKYKKYPSGVQFAEEQPEPGGYEVASSTTKWASTGASIGGPAGAAVGAGIGLAKGLYDRKKIKEANRQIRAEKEAYDDFGGYATDPKLMSQEMIARYGKKSTKQGVIEIEGKRGVGEIHTDSNFNLKNVGTKPHSQGGDKVVAEEGDIVFDVQGDTKKHSRIMRNIKRYKRGDKAAGRYLEKERRKLPVDTAPKKPNGDGDIIPPTAFGIPQDMMDKKRNVAPKIVPEVDEEELTSTTPPYAVDPTTTNPFAPESTSGATPTANPYGLPDGVTVPKNLSFDPNTQNLTYNSDLQSKFDAMYGSDDPYMDFLLKPETQTSLQSFREMEAEDPKGAYAAFQQFMADNNMGQSNDYMDWLRVQGFDPGKEGYGDNDIRNYETMTLDSSLRYLDEYNKAKKNLDDNLFSVTDKPYEEPIPPVETPVEADDELEVEEAEPESKEKKKRKRSDFLNKLKKNANVVSNMIDFAGPIEGYQKSGLKLDRYKYQDMSAPKIKEANTARAIRANNRRNMVASRGQHVAQAAQDEVMVQQAKERIFNDEITRKMNIENANVDLVNLERQAGYQEDIRAKDIERMQRAKKRQFGRAAMAEIAQMADLDEEKMYMMKRDDKLYARDAMLANILGSRSYDLNVSRDEETGEYNEDVDVTLRPEYKIESTKKIKEDEEEDVDKKRKGSRNVKLNTKRYKR